MTFCSPIDLDGMKQIANELLNDLGPIGFLESSFETAGGVAVAVAVGADPATAAALIPLALMAWTIWQYEHQKTGGNCGYIDPSGTVVNTSGSAVSGATVTLLEQSTPPSGPFRGCGPLER